MAGTGALLAAYLVVGPDELRRRRVIARLKGRLEPGLADFNLDELSPNADTNPADLLASLNTLPVGPGPRVVIVSPADRLPKAVSEAIVSYLANPNPGCTLLLVATTLAKGTRLRKAVAGLGREAVIECAAKSRRELPAYVCERIARAHGVTMGHEAALELIARVGESTTMLDSQVSALAALMGGTGAITPRMVEENVSRTAEVRPWEFLDRVSERDAARSLELYRLLRAGSQVGLLALMTTRIRELLCARALDARGQGASLAGELGKQAWQVRDHLRWARGFAPGELEALLGRCAACERVLKGTGDNDSALVRLILDICGTRA